MLNAAIQQLERETSGEIVAAMIVAKGSLGFVSIAVCSNSDELNQELIDAAGDFARFAPQPTKNGGYHAAPH
jgi:hypothetical protein